jgi:hypothetical protein
MITVATLAGIAAAFLGGLEGVKLAFSMILNGPNRGKIANSPIMASGGSMTFRAQGVWNCDSHTVAQLTYHTLCVSSAKVTGATIDWDNVVATPDGKGALGWSGLTAAWTLDIFARGNNGSLGTHVLHQSPEVRMCTSNTNVAASATCGATPPNYILIQVDGNSIAAGGVVGLVDTSLHEQTYAVQYFDSGCPVHTAAAGVLPACEHPGAIVVGTLDSTVYKCKDSSCQIAIY